MKPKKLLVLTNSIPLYRDPVYARLSEYYELTVAYYDKSDVEISEEYKQLRLTKFTIGPLTFIRENLRNICSQYDSCLVMGDLHVFSYMKLGFISNRRFSLTYWGGDVSFSYKKRYDEDRRLDKLRFYLMDKADSLVFYSSYPIRRYIHDGKISKDKLFVANNTVHVMRGNAKTSNKEHFIFIGTLYKEKNIFDLLEAYQIAFCEYKAMPKLLIVGDGDEYPMINNWIISNKMHDNIILKGAIYDNEELDNILSKSIACISPGQAGLSVLNCMGHGVPFITTKNAITGGEIFNIESYKNGIIYENGITELSDILVQLSTNIYEANRLGDNALDYYNKYATIDIMVNGLVKSVEHASKKS